MATASKAKRVAGIIALMLAGLWIWLTAEKSKQQEDKSGLRIRYFDQGLHYYIAARYTMIVRFIPMAGNLVHHAIEFLLKGALIEQLDEAARRKSRHNLQKLWRHYKRERNNPALAKFDQTISDINKFERIRYPEEILRLGMLAEIGPVRNTFPQPRGAQRPRGARYQLAFDEVDELVELIFQIEGLNPEFFTSSLDEDAKRYLQHQNTFPLTRR